MPRTQKNRPVEIATPLGDDVLLLTRMTASEQLGRLFTLELDLISENLQIKPADIIGRNVTVRLSLAGGENRYFNGYISRFVPIPTDGKEARYKATAVPWLWFLTRTADCRIFQEKTAPDIIKEILRDHGFTDFEDRLTGAYRTREYCVQYRETDFNFISRLMEQEGIYYFFEHDNGKHTLVFQDSISGHMPFPGYETIKYRPCKAEENEEVISQWHTEFSLQPGTCTLIDYDFKNTKKDLLTRSSVPRDHTLADFEIFDYPGRYVEFADGENYSKVRIEELQAQYEVASALTDARGVMTGALFTLADCPREDQNKEYLVVSAAYSLDAGDFESAGADSDEVTYSCSFCAIDSATPYRSLRSTPKPSIPGPQTAVVVGPSGEEIYTDQYGRIKVQFHWDRRSTADENSSCWIRVAQSWAGKKWGAVYLPRISQEVVVEFLEGDPDQPLVTGVVYNGANMPPYALPDEKTKSTLKTDSTKGSGGFNEIRFEDKKGSEQIFIHGQKNLDVRIKNDSLEFIGSDNHSIVKKNRYEKVEGDSHLTVIGDRVSDIQGDRSSTVGGDRLTEIAGNNHLEVSGDQFEKVAGNQHFKTVKNRNEEVGQKLSVKAGTDLHEKAGMNYALEAGMAVHIKGGMTVVIEGGAQLSLKVGGNFIDINPAGVFIKGTMVMINTGGAAGSGSGSSPTAPTAPEAPDIPRLPKEADTAQPGEKMTPPKPPKPPTPVKFSPQATTLKKAAESGTPFCEKCEAAKKNQKP